MGNTKTDLIVKGIVFNEMKGVYSNPASRAYELGMKGIYPDTIYGKDSGGNPDFIPELTYEDFLAFHQKYYHPSNSYIFIYGDIPTEKYLNFLSGRLSAFSAQDKPNPFQCQKRWEEPKSATSYYPVGANDDLEKKTIISLNWIIADATDIEDVFDRIYP